MISMHLVRASAGGRVASPSAVIPYVRISAPFLVLSPRGFSSGNRGPDGKDNAHAPPSGPSQTRADAKSDPPRESGSYTTNAKRSMNGKYSRLLRTSGSSTFGQHGEFTPSYPLSPSDHSDSINPFDGVDSKWADVDAHDIHHFDDLPHAQFGYNQDSAINDELRDVYRSILRQFRGVGYCFAYGSGVFPQSAATPSISDAEFRKVHPNPPLPLVKSQRGNPKMVDLIFGVWHTEHFHSLNIKDHPDHYSFLGSLGAQYVTTAQERWGAGVYFHPYITVNGIQIKYGVTSLANLIRDLSTWDTLYLAGRLQKPVRIVRDHPQVRFANQQNLIAAVRTAQLLLPERFNEVQLYSTIAGLSYLGDPRMALPTESPTKVNDIVTHNLANFRRLYAPIIVNLPAIGFVDYENRPEAINDPDWLLDRSANHAMRQSMEPHRRANIVRRLPPTFRGRLYFRYQRALGIPPDDFAAMMRLVGDEDPSSGAVRRRVATEFDMRVVEQGEEELRRAVRAIVSQTVKWPATTQSIKGLLSAGVWRSARYFGEKVDKWVAGRKKTGANSKSDV